MYEKLNGQSGVGLHSILHSCRRTSDTKMQALWLQVSWCKLEVTISTPKHIQAECSSLQGRVPPQLVVAAIHVKTRLTAQVSAV